MNQSQFHIESIGRSAINRLPSSPLLEVYPIETMTYVDGEITDVYNEDTVTGIDAFGRQYSVKVKMAITIEATYLPMDSNRLTPPDIRRGERVLIWRFGDADQYYWTTTGLDDYLRRLETIVYVLSNTRDESVTQLTPENSWFIRWCSRTKQIQLKTNRSDGESVSYEFLFDIAKGIVTLKDDLGNSFMLDSHERHFKLLNADASVFELNKQVANLTTGTSINLKTKDYTLNCTTVTVNTKTTVYKSPTITQTGDMTATGKLTWTGDVAATGALAWTGNVSATGSYAINGNVTTVGTFTNNGVNVGGTHVHAETNLGNTLVPH